MKPIEKKVLRVISKENLRSPNRKRNMNYKRIILARIMRDYGYTVQYIGSMFDRDHTTIVHMLKNYALFSNYKDFKRVEEEIKSDLNVKTLEEKILACKDYWQMVKLQEEVKKNLQH